MERNTKTQDSNQTVNTLLGKDETNEYDTSLEQAKREGVESSEQMAMKCYLSSSAGGFHVEMMRGTMNSIVHAC